MKKIWNWYYGTATIRKKLVISYLILILLPILILGLYSYHISKRSFLEQTRSTMEGNMSSIVQGMESNIQRENDNIKYLSYNVNFREKLEAGKKNVSELAQELNNSVEPTFWYFITSDDNIKSIEIYSPYVEHAIGSFLKPVEEGWEARFYQENEKTYKTRWNYEDGRIYAARTLLDAHSSSKAIGIMRVEVFEDNFISPIFQAEYLNNGVLLADADGKIYRSRPVSDPEIEEEIQTLVKKGDVSGFAETRRYMLLVSENLMNGWKIYYYVDKQEISGKLEQILAGTVLLMLVCLGVITVLVSIISRILSSRILRLKECAEEVSRGNFDIVISTDSTDEIGVVAKSFRDMCSKINEMMGEMYRLGLEKRAEELKALQAMINPHFLYNCLSSIKWKAIRAEQDEISDITSLLAKFYRTTLNHGKQITSVKNEIENIKAYLELQSRAHENSFDVEYALAGEGMELEMPNFLLQPIVENAICHGVEYCGEGERGRIRVVYEKKDGFLIFRIYNNGAVLEEEALNRILTTPGKGYGIYNIQERIRMYYDQECGISGSVSEEGMVCFCVRLKEHMTKAYTL